MKQIDKETPVRSDASINDTKDCRRRRVPVTLLALTASLVLAGAVTAAPAMAKLGIASFTSDTTNQDGTPATQAGSHPYQSVTSFLFTTNNQGLPTENVKDVQVDLPPGLIGDPNATSKCTIQELDQNACPGASQVGQIGLTVNLGSGPTTLTQPLYNLVPTAGVAAQFGANVLVVNSFVDVVVRTGGDYGLRTLVNNISANLPVIGTSLTLWGTPWDPSHDANRVCPGGGSPCSVGGDPKPLLTMPTACSGPLTTTLKANSWQDQTDFANASYQSQDSSGNPVGITGCGRLSINPSLSVQPDTTVADSPTGLNVDVHVPQAPDTPTALATPALKDSTVTLPSGFALNASTADGLAACSEAQFGLSNSAGPVCPNASKIGSAEIDSPLAADPLQGSIYLATPLVNEFHSPLAIYVTASADGVLVKLAGNVQINPATGQTTTSFDNTPQLPFSDLKLDFFSGPRATFATPESCGTFPVTASLTPWSGGTPTSLSDSFKITSGCVNGFNPSFVGGVTNTEAGASSSFVMSLSRSDTDQELSKLSVTLPPGVLAHLGGVPLCSNAQATAGTCSAASQVGTALTGAGPGPHPLFLPGKVFLTGPYKGAPFGLVEVVPVKAGPLNFGAVVVRQALNINKTDAHVTVVSDPFPTSLLGIIPLRLRRVDITLNRSGFMVNPTNCTPMKVSATLTSTKGTTVTRSSRFQVGGCGDLGFSPNLALKLTGKGKTKPGSHPTLSAVLNGHRGQANLRSVALTLPKSLALDAKNSQHVCSVAAAAADRCPANTIVGAASAVTSLLRGPLSGKVYLVQGERRNSSGQLIKTLPSLLIPLRGAIALDITAHTSVSHGKLVTTFPAIPDTPVSKFTITISGGSHGLLAVTSNLCSAKQKASAHEAGQNGRIHNATITLGTPCGAHHGKKK